MKIIKKVILLVLMLSVFGCSKNYNYSVEEINGKNIYVINENKYIESNEETDYVKIDIDGKGIMIAKLYPDIAPITVANFKKLVSNKYYDNTIFHRVIRDFMIQGGIGEETTSIKGEFKENGFDNKLTHERGVLSMARLGGNPETSETYNSASSQFFIMHKANSSLDGKYASFGEVIEGIELVDKIASTGTDTNDKPINNQIINSIRFVSPYEIKTNYKKEDNKYKIENKSYIETTKKTNLVKIELNSGIMIAELYPSVAPITVSNFKDLVSKKYYDNLIFHRVIKDFMIQTGDPLGNGTGGSDKKIKGEFKLNGFDNKLSHTRGVLSMARLGANPDTSETMNSASSQFFIVHSDYPSLDDSYASFGKLLYGYDILDNIARVYTDSNDKPIDTIRINSIRFIEEGE